MGQPTRGSSTNNFKGHHGLVIGAVLGAAATAAYYHGGAKAESTAVITPAPPLEQHTHEDDPSGSVLPPNHPPIGAMGSGSPHAGDPGAMGAMGKRRDLDALARRYP